MTLSKMKVLSAAALIAVSGAVQAAVSQPRHVTIEYEYVKDGEIVSRKINGAVQRYEYDLRGQLTGVYDREGKAVESYTYDAAGNILKKTVNGETTTFTYDGANQLVSKEDASGTTTYAYDAAGRMIREGGKEYRYSYLDKITSVVENGETAATMDYFVGGQLASVTRGNEAETFIWDGLALVHRDGSDYLNEPAIGGGNPVASNGKVMFNDMLGTTVAVKGDDGLGMTSMTAFGESSDSGAFFTGKPFIGEIGYVFLMRSYRPENGKWQTADPLGYPDGWNNLAYCNNGVTSCVDLWGCVELDVVSNLFDCLQHYSFDNGDLAIISESVILQSTESDGYVAEIQRIMFSELAYPNISSQTGSATFYHEFLWDQGSVLGRNLMQMDVWATWSAGSWFQFEGRYARNVSVRLDIYLSTEDNWDFEWHDGDSFWTTLTHEFAPELVAEMYSTFFGSHDSGVPFLMMGDAFTFTNYSFLQLE